MTTDTITIPRWVDRHLHLRDGNMLEAVLPHTLSSQADAAVIMGNLPHPFETSRIDRAVSYRMEIEGLLPEGSTFKPIMTCYLTDAITPEEVVRGFKEGAWRAVKLYLAGANGTTNSGHGVKNLRGRYPVFAAMEKAGIPLLGHFETVEPGIDEFDREIISVHLDLAPLIKSFPALPIVFEHLSDGRAADFILSTGPNVYATVTAHHLMITRNNMFTGGMQPLNYCKPVPKLEKDRIRLREIVTSGNRRFGAGTDSAPHQQLVKSRCTGCAAGIYTAPAAPELYATVFDEGNAMEHLGPFLSENLLHLYGLAPSQKTMTLVREPFLIPEMLGPLVGGIYVFKGGETLPWKLVGR